MRFKRFISGALAGMLAVLSVPFSPMTSLAANTLDIRESNPKSGSVQIYWPEVWPQYNSMQFRVSSRQGGGRGLGASRSECF